MTPPPTLAVRFSGPRRSFLVTIASRETIFFAGSLCKDRSYERSFLHPLTHPLCAGRKRSFGTQHHRQKCRTSNLRKPGFPLPSKTAKIDRICLMSLVGHAPTC